MTVLTPVFPLINIIIGLICICAQVVIMAAHGDCAYSKMGVGIWNGILLILTAIALMRFQKTYIEDSILVLCGMSLMASLLQAGIACGVIYQISNLIYFEHKFPFFAPKIEFPFLDFLKGIFGTGTNMGVDLAKGLLHLQVRTCYGPSFDKIYTGGDQRQSLEYVLLACGLIATVVQIASLAVLRAKRPVVSPTVHYIN